MESSRLKNIIILILVLLNLSLLLSLGGRQTAARSARRQSTEQLVELFAANEVTLDPNLIPRKSPPASRTMLRNAEQEQKVAESLLGQRVTRSEQGSGTYAVSTFDSDQGAALFRANGSFEAAVTRSVEDVEAFCRSFCQEFGYRDLTFDLTDGTGTAAAVQYTEGYQVLNCTVTFSISDGRLAAVRGTHLPEDYTETASGEAPLSAAAALSAFLSAHQASGGVACTVTDISLCYELQSTTSAPMALVPVWRITTDIANAIYYVNCITGAVTHS